MENESQQTSHPSQDPSVSSPPASQPEYPINSQPAPEQSASQTNVSPIQPAKTKPPLAAQILYILAFIGLIFGLIGAMFAFLFSASGDGLFANLGIGIGITILVLTIASFYLVHEIKHGKIWALTTYSVILGIAILGTLASINQTSSRQNILGILIATPLVLNLWLKHRNYFH